MTDVYLYIPHPDDETLSMGLAATYYLSLGLTVHFVFMSRGPVTMASTGLDGARFCNPHQYTHDPANEHFANPAMTEDDIAAVRIAEGVSAAGAMGTVNGAGPVYIHEGSLGYKFGGDDWQNPTGVPEAQAIMAALVDAGGNSFHHTMSDTDRHPDHACLGHALRNLKNDPVYGPRLTGSRFFVSRLYWNYTKYPDVAQQAGLNWVSRSISNGRLPEYVDVLRKRVGPVYGAWNPAGNTYAVGWHQVQNQFIQNGLMPPTSTVGIDNLWHL